MQLNRRYEPAKYQVGFDQLIISLFQHRTKKRYESERYRVTTHGLIDKLQATQESGPRKTYRVPQTRDDTMETSC